MILIKLAVATTATIITCTATFWILTNHKININIKSKYSIFIMTNILDLFGRILISALFLLNGIFKISNFEGTISWMESFGLPGMFLIPAIILEIAGPVLIIIGYKTKLAAGLLSLFCIATAFIFHNDFADQMQFTSFLKNIALAGGFLILFVNGAKGFSLDNKFKK